MQTPPTDELLGLYIGLNPDSIGHDAIEAAVRRRMEALALPERAVYEDRLAADPAELQELVEEVAIPETWFFRDRGPFEFLPRWVEADWRPRRGKRPLRVLSLPSASGEEPYSVAMALLAKGFDDFQVWAVDIRRHAIDAARSGLYGASSFRGDDLRFRDRWFARTPEGFRIAPEVAARVVLETGNALDEKLFDLQPHFDVVLCRNLMIYLHPEARRRVVANLDRLLDDRGLLIAGHAETELVWRERFSSLHEPRAFAFRKRTEGTTDAFDRWAERMAKAGAEACRTPTVPVIAAHVCDPRLVEARSFADRGELEQAESLCRSCVATEACGEGYFLLGIVCQARGDELEAAEYFEKALAIDPMHQDAKESLALIRRGLDDQPRVKGASR